MYVFSGVLSLQGASIQSISNARGDKRGTRSSSRGKGPLTPINPPLPLPPWCVGVMSGMSQVPLSPDALFLVTHHQAFSAAHSATSLPLTDQQHTYTSTPSGICVPWCLTLNRPPQLNTTDRQTGVRTSDSGAQVLHSCAVGKKRAGYLFSPVWLPQALCLMEGRKETMSFKIHSLYLSFTSLTTFMVTVKDSLISYP